MEAPAWATDKIEFESAIVFYDKERCMWVSKEDDGEVDIGEWGAEGTDTLQEYLDRRIVKVAKHSQLNVEIVNE